MQLKQYFKNWNSNRMLKLVIGLLLGTAYVFSGEMFYLGFSIFLLVQVVFNFGCSACVGDNCTTNVEDNNKNKYNIKNLDIKNKNDK